MKIAALQLSSVGMALNRFDYYLRICQSQEIKVLLLGEYIFNPFFKELTTTPLSMLKEQSDFHIENFKKFARQYQLTIVAPLIRFKGKRPYKSIAKFSPTASISYYDQQILINYEHWNEEAFFANPIEPLSAPMTFKIHNIRFGVMFGYETHFDPMWQMMQQKKVEVALIPTISTFESQTRWQELLKMRAFTNHCYLLRANRIGEFEDGSHTWAFYGDSFLANPFGEIEATLGNLEELLVVDIDKSLIKESTKAWGFAEALAKRENP